MDELEQKLKSLSKKITLKIKSRLERDFFCNLTQPFKKFESNN